MEYNEDTPIEGYVMEVIIDKGCGLDVHKQSVVACIMGKGIKKEIQTFGTYTSELLDLKDWLKDKGITDVVICDGKLCIRDNFLWGKNVPIDHILSQASYYEFKKVSLVDIYRFCKKHGWGFSYYAEKFRKR